MFYVLLRIDLGTYVFVVFDQVLLETSGGKLPPAGVCYSGSKRESLCRLMLLDGVLSSMLK